MNTFRPHLDLSFIDANRGSRSAFCWDLFRLRSMQLLPSSSDSRQNSGKISKTGKQRHSSFLLSGTDILVCRFVLSGPTLHRRLPKVNRPWPKQVCQLHYGLPESLHVAFCKVRNLQQDFFSFPILRLQRTTFRRACKFSSLFWYYLGDMLVGFKILDWLSF